MAVKIIRTTKKVSTRKRYVPQPAWWKGLTKAQQEAYVVGLDHLDKGATKRPSDYRFCK